MAFSQFYANAAKRLVITSLATLMVTLAAPLSAADFGAGMRAYENGDFEIAYKEWLPLAEAGNADAQYWIGKLYSSGKGVKQDSETAFAYYLSAAQQGHGEAQHSAASSLFFSPDEKDKALAFSLYMRAAVNGVTLTYVDIAGAYCFGVGVDENPLLADVWMALALEHQGHRIESFEGTQCDIFTPLTPEYHAEIHRRAEALRYAYGLKRLTPPHLRK